MRHTPERHTDAADRTVKDIRRKTRKRYSSEDKIRIVLAGLRGVYGAMSGSNLGSAKLGFSIHSSGLNPPTSVGQLQRDVT